MTKDDALRMINNLIEQHNMFGALNKSFTKVQEQIVLAYTQARDLIQQIKVGKEK